MYLISYETANFSFCYVSQSEKLRPLFRAWDKHCKLTNADRLHLMENLDAVKILRVDFDQVYRDFEPFS
jgi:hypothetical protein